MRCLIGLLACIPTCLIAADAKWIHATSAHFDMYTANSEGDAKAALLRLEASRAFFLASTHTHDPGPQPVRIIAFKSDADYAKYRPADVRLSRAFGMPPGGGMPATLAVQDLKPDSMDQLFREYAQLALDDSVPMLPYWFRSGLAAVYSTAKPTDKGIDLGAAPRSSFRNGEVADVSLPLLFSASREAIMGSREKAANDFHTTTLSTGSNNGALATTGSRDPGGAASAALTSVQSSMEATQDFARSAWMLVHMLMFQQDYRTKFGEFMRTLATGQETGAVFSKVYGNPLSRVSTDLVMYSKQTGIMIMTAPFKFEMPSPPAVMAATKEEQDRVLGELAKPPANGAR